MSRSHRPTRRALPGLALLVVALLAGVVGESGAQTPGLLRVSAIPGESPTEVARRFVPLGRYLEKELEMRVEWVPGTDYDLVVDAVVNRRVDLAVLGGFALVRANQRSGGKIIPLVQREGDGNYRSVFITRVGSGIRRLEDLKGRTLSFGPATSTSGHLMPRAALLAAKIDPDASLKHIVFSSAHDGTVAAVASGKVDAGAVNLYLWERLVAEKKVDSSVVTVFFTTPPFYDANWSVHADMPVATREAIKAAFLKLNAATPEGREVLDLQRATKYVPTRIENYNGIKAAAENAGLLK